MPVALITGITGQDGRYLGKFLLNRGYEVIGVSRNAQRLAPAKGLALRDIDITDRAAMERLLAEFAIDEIYNLAGESYGPASWEHPVEAAQTLGAAVVGILEILRNAHRPIRFFQASSSELFGHAAESPQCETTLFRPLTPYGFSKLLAHWAVRAYREKWGVFACCGILFNHESPLRRPEFVTRKVTRAAANIRAGSPSPLRIGSLDARRDWAFAGDFAEGMWRMLQAAEPEDYVLATGEAHSIRELCETAFSYVGLDYRQHVIEDTGLVRPDDFDRVGDPSKAGRILGWKPAVSFRELVALMVEEDMSRLGGEARRTPNADEAYLQSL